MSIDRSGPLAAWARAWFAGRVSLDEVIDAVTGADAPHAVTGLTGAADTGDTGGFDGFGGFGGFGGDPQPLRELLVTWRRTGEPARVVLPVAGDVRGLPGPSQFRSTALEAGSAVICAAVGAVPEVTEYYPSSAPPSVLWAVTRVTPVPGDELPLGEAQYELTEAIRACASALSAAEVAGFAGDLSESLHGARRAGDQVNLPPRHPPCAVALLAQAQRLAAVLDLALADPAGGALDQHGVAARGAALRPLATAVRRAVVASYNAM